MTAGKQSGRPEGRCPGASTRAERAVICNDDGDCLAQPGILTLLLVQLRVPPDELNGELGVSSWGGPMSRLPVSRSAISKRTNAALAERFAPEPQSEGNDEEGLPEPEAMVAPATKRPGLPIKGLISALVGIALVPTAILFVLLWQGTMRPRADGAMPPAGGQNAASTPRSTGLAQPVKSSALEIALSSPDRIEAKAGEEIDFLIAIDATERLPSRCIIAVSGMPDGASFSEGRPYGATGWSLRPDEIGELRFRLPKARSGASDMRIELLAADGAVLAQSETRLNVAAYPTETETVSADESSSFEPAARAEAPKPGEALPPRPERKPGAKIEPSVKVTTVKVVTIKPPGRPHDGAFALGEAAEAPAEWVEIVRPVDMHARPEQSSETVKVAEKGLKFRVTARDKNWVQVSDPATFASGWIYSRFLKPTEPPAQ
jgi:SH3 domain-containing protein